VTHPSLLVQVLAPAQIVCLDVDDAERERIWESAPERAEMRGWVQALTAPADPWRRFLDFDRQINDTLVAESREHGIPVLRRTPALTVAALTDDVMAALWP
jgi:2-phosphoglycerate kinase